MIASVGAGAVGAGRHRVYLGELRRGEAALDRGGSDHPACGPAAGRPARARRPRRRPARPARTARRCAAGPAARPGRGPAAARSRTARPACRPCPATRIRRDAGSTAVDLGPGRLDRGPDELDVGRVGAVPVGQLVAAHPLAGRQRGAPPQHDRDLGPLTRVDRADDLGAGDRRPDAARDPHARLALHPFILPQRQDRPRSAGQPADRGSGHADPGHRRGGEHAEVEPVVRRHPDEQPAQRLHLVAERVDQADRLAASPA